MHKKFIKILSTASFVSFLGSQNCMAMLDSGDEDGRLIPTSRSLQVQHQGTNDLIEQSFPALRDLISNLPPKMILVLKIDGGKTKYTRRQDEINADNKLNKNTLKENFHHKETIENNNKHNNFNLGTKIVVKAPCLTLEVRPDNNRPITKETSDAQKHNDDAIAKLYQGATENEEANPSLANHQHEILVNKGVFDNPSETQELKDTNNNLRSTSNVIDNRFDESSYYKIINKYSGNYLSRFKEENIDSVAMQAAHSVSSDDILWKLIKDNEFYKIINKNGKILNSWDGKHGIGIGKITIQQNDGYLPDHRLWTLIEHDGFCRIKNKEGNVVNCVGNEIGENSASMEKDDVEDHAHRLWKFIRV